MYKKLNTNISTYVWMKSLRSTTSNNNYSNISQGPTCIAPNIVGRSARAGRRRRLRVVNLTARAAASGAPLASVHYHKSKLLYRCIIIIITYLYVCIHIYISLSLCTDWVHPRGTPRGDRNYCRCASGGRGACGQARGGGGGSASDEVDDEDGEGAGGAGAGAAIASEREYSSNATSAGWVGGYRPRYSSGRL